MTTMRAWLAGLDEAELAALLTRRDDALAAPQPRTLSELEARLAHPSALATALQELPVPCVQLAEALVALGPCLGYDEVLGFVGSDPGEVPPWLAALTGYGLAWLADGDTVGYPSTLGALFGAPLGLGPPLYSLTASTTVDTMRRLLRTLGVPNPPTRRAEMLAEVHRVLTDAEFVRRVADSAPPQIAAELYAWAAEGGADDDSDDDDVYFARSYDRETSQRRSAAAKWAVERGLVFGQQWSYRWQMPAEIARALRGPGYRAPFTPQPPPVAVSALDPDDVDRQGAGAIARTAELALAVVDRLTRVRLPALKSGGVGSRELSKLAKALDCPELQLRLVLEILAGVGVIDEAGGWGPGPMAQPWRELGPAERTAILLLGWLQLPLTPGETRDHDGKAVPALTSEPCSGCLRARHAVLQTLAELGPNAAATTEQLGARTLWRRPFVHVLTQDVTDTGAGPFATQLAEATALGVVASGALTGLGAALLADDAERVHTLLTRALPESTGSALFGADLTAVVPGAPTAAVSRVLDASADREGRGGATVWRFSPASVRRALDEGQSGAALLADLEAIATGELPQPLRYLVNDIARRHGSLRVGAATAVVTGLDQALIAQVCADRALRRLGLRPLAPTVLAADAEPETVLAAMRKAGYLPMPEAVADATGGAGSSTAAGAGGGVSVGRGAGNGAGAASGAGAKKTGAKKKGGASTADDALDAELRTMVREWIAQSRPDAVRAEPAAPLDPTKLAARLLAQPADAVAPRSPTEKLLAAARALSAEEIRLLAHAVDTGSRVGIDYIGQSGAPTRRVITNLELSGSSVYAWCELRQDDRWFRLERIQSVFPAT